MSIWEKSDIQYHLKCKRGDVGRYVLMPGDPGRVAKIASYLTNARQVSKNREYLIYTGVIDDIPVSVCSTGIGCPSTAIAVEELVNCGADTFIRVGTSGMMQPNMLPGDLVVATASIRDEGTSRQYLPLEFPAVADISVVSALVAACKNQKLRYHTGIVHSKDSFYGEVEASRMPMAEHLQNRWKTWIAGGALCSEMEASTLFVVSSVLGKRAGALMLAEAHDGMEKLCQVAVEGVRNLIQIDCNDN
jgi:uridine phosphorylase